jgi:Macrocin-O-methyltransferase (TylF)
VIERMKRALRERLKKVVDEVVSEHDKEFGEVIAEHYRELSRQLTVESDRVIQAVNDVEFRARRDIFAAAERDAALSSARFAQQELTTARTFHHPDHILEFALDLATLDGMALEFGVWTGRTLRMIAEHRGGQEVYGFDSFKGLPEDWRPNIPAGTFSLGDGQPPEVPGAELVIGWFEDTLPGFLAEHNGPVAFLHVDADLYSSTKLVLEHVGPRLVPGSVIIFDEYFNYPGWEEHEHRAWQEYVKTSGIEFRFEAYTSNNEQVALVVTATPEQ